MNDAEINIEIAEACGWKTVENADGDLSEPHLSRNWTEWLGPNGEQDSEPPDYCHNLDAMHEAEKVLTDHTGYMQQLGWIVGTQFPFFLSHAASLQRAEAFLRVKGLWKESK